MAVPRSTEHEGRTPPIAHHNFGNARQLGGFDHYGGSASARSVRHKAMPIRLRAADREVQRAWSGSPAVYSNPTGIGSAGRRGNQEVGPTEFVEDAGPSQRHRDSSEVVIAPTP